MTQQSEQPIFELRQYNLKEGQLDRWVEWMDTVLIPFQRSVGMVIVGSWHVREENKYIWIRRFENESDRKSLYVAAYENDHWLNELRPIVNEMLDREKGLDVTDMEPSRLSVIR